MLQVKTLIISSRSFQIVKKFIQTSFMLTWLVLLSMTNITLFTWWTVVKAYQYTSLTSVMLLDCWSIPCVMLLTWIFLKTKYRFKKITGVIICIAGLVLVVFSDVHAGDRAGMNTDIYILCLYLKTHAHTCIVILGILEIMQQVKFDPIYYNHQWHASFHSWWSSDNFIFTYDRWKQSS